MNRKNPLLQKSFCNKRYSLSKRIASYLVIIVLASSFAGLATVSAQSNVVNSAKLPSSGSIIQNLAHTDGTQVIDPNGKAIVLRGTNFWGYEIGTFSAHTAQDYVNIAKMGFNVVRLPIAWSYIEPNPGSYDLNYLIDIVNRDIVWAKENGLYIVLDMHQWYWSPYFKFIGSTACGMPTWLVSNYSNSNTGLATAIDDFWLGKGPNGTIASVSNPSMQDRFIAAWTFVAQQFANESTIIAYDLFNEPWNGGEFNSTVGMDFMKASAYLNAFYPKLIDAIRVKDANHILMYEPIGAWAIRTAVKIDRPNLIFSFHWWESFYQNYSKNIDDMEKFLVNNRLNVPTSNPVTNWNMPIFMGEFGTDSWRPNAQAYVEDTLKLWEKYNLGWAWWTYDRSDWYGKALLYENGAERTSLTQPLYSIIQAHLS